MGEEPTITPLPSRGGRPKKYATDAERQAAIKANRKKHTEKAIAAKEAVPVPPLPPLTPSSTTLDIQIAIAKATAGLSVPDAVFVSALCSGKSATEAYKLSHPESSGTAGPGHALLAPIAQALAEVKLALAATVAYNFESFMAEMERAMAFAHATRNATAYVRAVELRGKATGSLSDKPAGGASNGFTLNIVGIDTPVTLERAE